MFESNLIEDTQMMDADEQINLIKQIADSRDVNRLIRVHGLACSIYPDGKRFYINAINPHNQIKPFGTEAEINAAYEGIGKILARK